MHFKGLPWDFLHKHSLLLKRVEKGLWGFYCSDFYLQKILLSRMGMEQFSVRWGEDVTPDWFRDNIIHVGLFSTNTNYLIYGAEHLSRESREVILKYSIQDGQKILLCFSKKEKFFDEISKTCGATLLHIELPRFWEGEKTLNFLCEQMRLSMAGKAKQYLLDALPNKIPNFVQVLKFLSLNASSGRELSKREVVELVEDGELSPFDLADMLSLKKFKEFYGALVEKRVDFDTYRSIFSFMQTHLLKLGEPGYAEKKSRLSRYDRNILSRSKNWSEDEIGIQLRCMGEWEILAKKRDPFLHSILRRRHIGSL